MWAGEKSEDRQQGKQAAFANLRVLYSKNGAKTEHCLVRSPVVAVLFVFHINYLGRQINLLCPSINRYMLSLQIQFYT